MVLWIIIEVADFSIHFIIKFQQHKNANISTTFTEKLY